MKIERKSQTGIAALVAIAVVIVVATLAGTGLYVAKHPTKKSAVVVTPTPAPTPSGAETNPTPPPAQTTQHVLVIKEWDVQIPIPGTVNDLYYVVSNSSVDADGNPDTIWLGTASLDAAGCHAADANNGGKPIASISRVKPGDTEPVSGKLYAETHPNGVTSGSYYYFYSSWAKSNTCVPAATLTTIDSALSDAIKSTAPTSAASKQ